MARVFYHGAYKAPREFNWVIGVILLTLTLLLSFTGYLLPWDQLALWAVTVGTNMIGYTPVFGRDVRFVLLGGAEIGVKINSVPDETLAQFRKTAQTVYQEAYGDLGTDGRAVLDEIVKASN